MNQIQGMIEKNDDTEYLLTPLGEKTLHILEQIRSGLNKEEQAMVKQTYISQRDGIKPLVLQGISFGIAAMVFFTGITIFLLVISIIEQQSLFVIPILGIMIIGEVLGVIWLIRLRMNLPVFLERVNKYFKE
ncbi:MAG: hypothetical protein GF308_20255 [Candidatus Heimdallarchaeota archaeon]|nr:hypothetical protein [Candidatus Heimdallarchaeota archaeon]